ncbi:hypothetical protein [Mycobacterium sp. 1274761.0]|uniref:hypothetical protein n=1 Tax=Mycobacterium sp. 1274761.0 TaxID=1834077 RepID=UPI0007FFC214|nr:hypothetical protein [Mycobacterium sp. 1274761.0]OBK70741.1 hypothetical protein A5651_21125 [Mycobacterium sp. 1274761.0]
MDHLTTGKALGYVGLALIVVGGVAAMMPWKSRRVSTASIQRRVYWTGAVTGAMLLFVSQLPDWRSGLFVAVAVALVLVLMAYRFTSHIKIGGKVYEFMRDPRQPDPPPALGDHDD